jgi:hypothetical protein
MVADCKLSGELGRDVKCHNIPEVMSFEDTSLFNNVGHFIVYILTLNDANVLQILKSAQVAAA